MVSFFQMVSLFCIHMWNSPVYNVCNHHYEIGEMYGENVVNSSLLFDKGCIKRKVFIPDRYSIEKCKILVDKGNKLNQL